MMKFINLDTVYINTPSIEQITLRVVEDIAIKFKAVNEMQCSRNKLSLLYELHTQYENQKNIYMRERDIVAYTPGKPLNVISENDTAKLDAIQFIGSLCDIVPNIQSVIQETEMQLNFIDKKTNHKKEVEVKFRDYLIAQDIDGLLDEIRLLAGSEKGVRIAEIIIALRKLELIQPFGVRKHLYKAIEEFLGYNIGTKSAINPILNDYENNTLDDKRKGFIEQMESRLLRYKKV